MRRHTLSLIRVRPRPGPRNRGHLYQGWLCANTICLPVALGRCGIKANKREGDGGTPRGTFHLKRLWWRPDRLGRPVTRLPVRQIGHHDAWSEDPLDRRYNRPVRRQAGEPGDRLWREDHLYDLIIEIDHNDRPRIAGRGSAVFIHLARPGFAPTAGCIGLEKNRLLRLLERLGPTTRIEIR